ncbi:hypothetical protein [Mycobacterium deserti]|uniref:Lipoprotein n=1 Tax=Mycobacterium deserti TaxID=2978347 RepID=A0ABT2MGT1_9MYCO|nr:hypothetical protein [Mycobacterium deserti]MCT7661467.1 hypothetical protein [Mycobacterium deserti]
MRSGLLGRRLAAGVGGVAILAMVGLTASCGQEEEAPSETETTTTTTTTTTAPPATSAPVNPTEKAPRIEPGPNPFSPTVHAPPAPTAIPGDN